MFISIYFQIIISSNFNIFAHFIITSFPLKIYKFFVYLCIFNNLSSLKKYIYYLYNSYILINKKKHQV